MSCLFCFCHPCYRSCNDKLYSVTPHETNIALDFCEVGSVSFLKTLNYLIKVYLEVTMKQLTEVDSESDR